MKLISFTTCPYVQRSAMLLAQLGQTVEIEYIDLANPPAWFLAISPLGKVPVLQVDNTVLFESHVILEYLNEVAERDQHPSDPLEKARHRAMMEFGSAMLGSQWVVSAAKSQAQLNKQLDTLKDQLSTLESNISPAPYYEGEVLHIIDFSFAPLLQRLDILKRHFIPDLFEGFPKTEAWKEALVSLDVIKRSAVPDLEAQIIAGMKDMGAYLTQSAG